MNKYKSSFYNIYKNNNDGNNEIFNSFSKANAIVEDDLFEYLKNDKLDNIDEKTIESLLDLGFIVPKNIDEFKVIKENYIKYRANKDMLLITLIPTFMCNFRCKYCFEGSDAKEDHKIIDFGILKKYANQNFEKYKHIHITLFGGEPLLCYEKIVDFYNHLKLFCEEKKQTYSSSIATNAYLLNRDVITGLINICNCQTFQITIDGCERTHNMSRCLPNGKATFDKVQKNFKTLLEFNNDKKLNIVLRVNLFNNTLEEVKEFLEGFSEEEKSKFSIYFRNIYNTKEFQEENKNEINLKEFYNIAKEKQFTINSSNNFSFYHCEGDGSEEQIHILPDLKVYKCINDMTFDKSYIGNIDTDGKIIFNDNLNIWNDYSFFDDDECKKCKYLPMCWGGCPLIYKKRNKRVCIHEKTMEEKQKNRKEEIKL